MISLWAIDNLKVSVAGAGPTPVVVFSTDFDGVLISPTATVTDVDSPDFNGGSLTVSFTANGTTSDQLSIQNQGTGSGEIGVSGNNVTFGGVIIGTFIGGTNGSDLVISLNGNSTAAAVQALTDHILYLNASDAPSTLPRTVTFTVNDGDGGTSTGSATATVNVTAVNDPPAVVSGATLNYTENGAPTAISPLATVTDVDSPDFNGGSLTVSFTANGTTTDQLSIQNQGTGFGQIGVSGNNVTFGGVSIGTFIGGTNGSDLVVSLNGSAATPAAVQALADHILYSNTSDAPSILARTVTFAVNDGDGATGFASATINVTAVNDAPVVVSGATLNYTENGAAAAISPAATVTDVDSSDFNGGSLTVSFSANGTTADQLTIENQGTLSGQIGVSGSNVTFGGVTIGTFSGGTNGSDLVVSLNGSAATPAAVQALADHILYSNTSDAPSTLARTVTFAVNDGDGATGFASATVNITAVNDSPDTNAGSGTGFEDATSIPVSLSGTDIDGTVASFRIVNLPSNGVLYSNAALTVPVIVGGSGMPAVGNAATVFFVPAANFNGSTSFQYVAIDNLGAVDDTSATASITVTAVNDAPVASGSATLAAINEDTAAPAGATVSSLFSGNFSDATDQVTGGSSANTFAGIAISSYTLDATKGNWQYSTNSGGSWTTLGSATTTTAITLDATDHAPLRAGGQLQRFSDGAERQSDRERPIDSPTAQPLT